MQLQVPAGSTIADVVDAAARLGQQAGADIPHADLARLAFLEPGVWGRKSPWTTPVQAGDRVELYRPLIVDPKVARRQRFKRQGKGRTGLFANRKRGAAAGY
jgi:putative ubiquitin-RnfH superfamily antitoxin RatB of RatAB toxin-antitoxin module